MLTIALCVIILVQSLAHTHEGNRVDKDIQHFSDSTYLVRLSTIRLGLWGFPHTRYCFRIYSYGVVRDLMSPIGESVTSLDDSIDSSIVLGNIKMTSPYFWPCCYNNIHNKIYCYKVVLKSSQAALTQVEQVLMEKG